MAGPHRQVTAAGLARQLHQIAQRRDDTAVQLVHGGENQHHNQKQGHALHQSQPQDFRLGILLQQLDEGIQLDDEIVHLPQIGRGGRGVRHGSFQDRPQGVAPGRHDGPQRSVLGVAFGRGDRAGLPEMIQAAFELVDFPSHLLDRVGIGVAGVLQTGGDAVGLHAQRAGQVERGGVALAGFGDEHRTDHAQQRQQHDAAHGQAVAENDRVVTFHWKILSSSPCPSWLDPAETPEYY